MPAARRPPVLVTPRLVLRLPGDADAQAVVRYYERNRVHLAPWEPARSDAFYTETFWGRQIAHAHAEFLQDRSCRLFLFDKVAESRGERVVVGNAGLSNIVRASPSSPRSATARAKSGRGAA